MSHDEAPIKSLLQGSSELCQLVHSLPTVTRYSWEKTLHCDRQHTDCVGSCRNSPKPLPHVIILWLILIVCFCSSTLFTMSLTAFTTCSRSSSKLSDLKVFLGTLNFEVIVLEFPNPLCTISRKSSRNLFPARTSHLQSPHLNYLISSHLYVHSCSVWLIQSVAQGGNPESLFYFSWTWEAREMFWFKV